MVKVYYTEIYMTRVLNGQELVDFIKVRQLRQARNLRQQHAIIPTLVIVHDGKSPVNTSYLRVKQRYGDDIAVDVREVVATPSTVIDELQKLAKDSEVHGIIVQLPFESVDIDELVAAIPPKKDVDGLRADSVFIAATAQAIDWLVTGYNVTLTGKKIAIIGQGRLVGAPLAALYKGHGYDITTYEEGDSLSSVAEHDIIITATGVPGLITNELVNQHAVVVDAGTATEDGRIVGDVADSVRQRDDVTITPVKGGVGPLTVASLFENVLHAARLQKDDGIAQ